MIEEKIKIQAKSIMDNFARVLETVNLEQSHVERKEYERKEQEPWDTSAEFKQKILENAPKKDNDCIIAEKGAWT